MKRNLRSEVTVFLISVGEPTTEQAKKCLDQQTCDFTFELIENVYPMSEAYQQMIDRCETTFFVQVDADMLLEPNAIESLYTAISKGPRTTVAMVAKALYDTHLGMPIIGVKIYDHYAMSTTRYADVEGCELNHLDQLAEEGWTYTVDFEVVGKHVTALTNHQAFERYRTLMRRQIREGHSPWVERSFSLFVDRFRKEGSKLDLFAVLGLVVGLCDAVGAHADTSGGEKDARRYGTEVVFKHLERIGEVQ